MTDDAPFHDATLVPNAPSTRVVNAVADAEGVDPVDLDPLFGAIDSSALDRLFEPTDGGAGVRTGTVTFEYAGYAVTVDADGTVTLD